MEATKRGLGGYIEVTRTATDAWAEMDELTATTINGYPTGAPYTIWEYWQRYREYGTGLGISAAQYNSAGSATRIKSAVIDGDQLKITLTNTSGSANATITLDGKYRVEGIA